MPLTMDTVSVRVPKVMAMICPLLSPSSVVVVLSSVVALAVAGCREQKYSHYGRQGSFFSYLNHMQTSRPPFFIQGVVQDLIIGHASLENTVATW